MIKYCKTASFISVPVIVLSVISIAVLEFSRKDSDDVSPVITLDTSIRIAVFNGCGREGLALVFTDELRAHGFDVVNGNGGNADSFDFDESIVFIRKGDREKAKTVADLLGIGHVIEQYSANPYTIEDVAVVLGRDWDSLNVTGGK